MLDDDGLVVGELVDRCELERDEHDIDDGLDDGERAGDAHADATAHAFANGHGKRNGLAVSHAVGIALDDADDDGERRVDAERVALAGREPVRDALVATDARVGDEQRDADRVD